MIGRKVSLSGVRVDRGVASIDPWANSKDVDHGKEVPAEFFEPCGQSSHVRHGAEESFDDVAHSVEIDVVIYRRFGVDLRRNDRESARIGYRFF